LYENLIWAQLQIPLFKYLPSLVLFSSFFFKEQRLYNIKLFRALIRSCAHRSVSVNFYKRRMERARSVISDSDLRSKKRGKKQERRKGGIKSNRTDGRERNFFGRTAAAEQRTWDIKEEFLRAHVAPARERERERERENPHG